jgi:hypothetical protein
MYYILVHNCGECRIVPEQGMPTPSDLETQQKVMHNEEIELNFVASFQQILGSELEISWEARSTPTLATIACLQNFV